MHRCLALLPVILLASACSDSSAPGTPASGTVSFSYSGAQSGEFTVSGAINSMSNPATTQPWAVGIRDQSTTSIGIVANRPGTQGAYDIVVISANRLTTGSAPIDANCDPNFDTACDGVAVVFNASDTQASATMLVCVLASGTVNVASVTSTRVTGSFSGSGSCTDQSSVETGFTVTDGAFDVALTSSSATALSTGSR